MSSPERATEEPEGSSEEPSSGIAAKFASWMPFKAGVPDWLVLALLLGFVLLSLAGIVVRAFSPVEAIYNEGWNAYNAQAALQHHLYPYKYGWTTVNYPFLSFYLIGHLSLYFGDPVRIGRMLSLLSLFISCLCVAAIVKKLTGRWSGGIFSAIYCLWIVIVMAIGYVATNDPQIMALACILLALLLYIRAPESNRTVLAVAFLFVLGGNIKHNLLAAPLAVFLDLLFRSWSRAARFVIFGIILLVASLYINQWAGGPYFTAQLLTPRTYSISKLLVSTSIIFPLAVPLLIAAVWSLRSLCNVKYRVIALYFFISLFLGIAFYGGGGTTVNMFFDCFFAVAIILGVLLDRAWQSETPWLKRGGAWRWAVPLLLFQVPCVDIPPVHLHPLMGEKKEFKAEVAFLAAQQGPAICESLLRCYYAGKPYILDPFNSASLVRLGKLDGNVWVQRIANKEFGAIQTYQSVSLMERPNARFPDAVLDAIDKYYKVAMQDSKTVIYVPQ
ncbi:MAG TPA: glycosyltransferase family 39 protein [Terracidiphilus sp.]